MTEGGSNSRWGRKKLPDKQIKTHDRGLVAGAGRDRRKLVRLKVWVCVAFSPSKNWEEFVSSGFYFFHKVRQEKRLQEGLELALMTKKLTDCT